MVMMITTIIRTNTENPNTVHTLIFAANNRTAVIKELPSLTTSPKRNHSVANLMTFFRTNQVKNTTNAVAKTRMPNAALTSRRITVNPKRTISAVTQTLKSTVKDNAGPRISHAAQEINRTVHIKMTSASHIAAVMVAKSAAKRESNA